MFISGFLIGAAFAVGCILLAFAIAFIVVKAKNWCDHQRERNE